MEKSCLLLFGGAFNPMHNGHVLHIKAVENQLKRMYENVRVCVSVSRIKHFDNTKLVDTEERFNAVKEVCLDYENWFAIEEKSNYSIDTVNFLKNRFDVPIYLLIGMDQARLFDRWYRSNELLDLIEDLAIFDKESGHFTIGENRFFTNNFLNISSTEIRNMIKEGKTNDELKHLVPEPSLELFRYYI